MTTTATRPGPTPHREIRFRILLGIVLLMLLFPARVENARAGEPQTTPQPGHVLVAGRDVTDPGFAETVVMLVQHDDTRGTLGLILNRPIPHSMAEAFPELGRAGADEPVVFFGGPVGVDTLMYLYRAEQPHHSSVSVTDDMNLSADREFLSKLLAAHPSQADLRVFLGHAGWLPRQLEEELARGDWHLVPSRDAAVLQADPAGMWQQMIERIEPPGVMARLDVRELPGRDATPIQR